MFYLSLNKVKILNNRELLGRAEIQLMSFVTPGESDFPMIGDFFETNDENVKKEIVKQCMKAVISSRIMPPIQKIKDNQTVYFGDCGFIVHKSDAIPLDLNWMLMAIELDKDNRDNTALIKAALTDKNINSIVGAISTLSKIPNPVSSAITTLTSCVANTLISIFEHDKDDQAGLYITSFIRQQHYPNGHRDKQDSIDSTGNMFVDYTIFGY